LLKDQDLVGLRPPLAAPRPPAITLSSRAVLLKAAKIRRSPACPEIGELRKCNELA
jgi:hypothetical protein